MDDCYKIKWFYNLNKKLKRTNWGHRLYDLDHPATPENSLASLKLGLDYQYHERFKYWEFDVIESLDGELFVFHDATERKTIKRLCPNAPEWLKKKSIYELTSQQIRSLTLMDSHEHIPTFSEVLESFKQHHNLIVRPIKIEIKKLLSQAAKLHIVQITSAFKQDTKFDVSFLMFESKFKKVFAHDKLWFKQMLLEYDLTLSFI